MKEMNRAIKYQAPTAIVLTAADELLDRQSLLIDDTYDTDDDLEFGYDDFWN